jgi:hypothetical protein
MKLITSFLFAFLCANVSAQTISFDITQEYSSNHITVLNNKTASLTYKMVECNDPQNGLYAKYAFLTASNKTTRTIEISWHLNMFYNDVCISCNDNKEHTRKIILQPNETATASCDPSSNSNYKIFSKWTQLDNKRVLTKMEFTNISITETH